MPTTYTDQGYNQFLTKDQPAPPTSQLDPLQAENLTDSFSGEKIGSMMDGQFVGAGVNANNITVGQMSFDRARGGELVLGGQGNRNGTFALRDEENNDRIIMDKNGMMVDNGQIVIKNAQGKAIIDSGGLTIDNFGFIENSVTDASNQQTTAVFPTATLLTNGTINIVLKRVSKLLILINANAMITRNSIAGDYGLDGFLLLYLDGVQKRSAQISGSNIGGDRGGNVDSLGAMIIHWIVTLPAGAHVLEAKIAVVNVTGNAVFQVNAYRMSEVPLSQ